MKKVFTGFMIISLFLFNACGSGQVPPESDQLMAAIRETGIDISGITLLAEESGGMVFALSLDTFAFHQNLLDMGYEISRSFDATISSTIIYEKDGIYIQMTAISDLAAYREVHQEQTGLDALKNENALFLVSFEPPPLLDSEP